MLHFVSPNRNELKVIGEHLGIPVAETMDLAAVKSVAERLVQHVPVVITTLGAQGVLVRIPPLITLPKSPLMFHNRSIVVGDPKSRARQAFLRRARRTNQGLPGRVSTVPRRRRDGKDGRDPQREQRVRGLPHRRIDLRDS